MSDDQFRYARRSVVKLTGALGALFGAAGIASAEPKRSPGPKRDELLVGVSASADDVAETVTAAAPSEAVVTHTNSTLGYATVTLPESVPDHARKRRMAALERARGVDYVEENATVEAIPEPDDTYYDEYQYAPQQINCEEAWETTTGDSDVTISVVDQGTQYDHPDLDDTLGDRMGVDIVGGDENPYPSTSSESHGTAVAGVASGETDNGEGHAGISNCSYLSVRALDADGSGSMSDIADAIQWSADNGADIINLSLGSSADTRTLRTACEYAWDEGCLLVAAAGNGGGSVTYPAAYATTIAVSALDSDETLASYSNRGPEIDIAAPGTSVVTAAPVDGYTRLSGTSVAAPIVSGVAGLTLSVDPTLSNTALRNHLETTAVDVGLSERAQGSGRVDAGAAVSEAASDSADDPESGDDSDDSDSEETCGAETVTASAEDSLSDGWYSSHTYTYSLQTADPCSVTVTLDGPTGADFDLYLTLDGSTPSWWAHDEASAGAGSTEEIAIALDGDEELGLRVDAADGSGIYELRVEERGR